MEAPGQMDTIVVIASSTRGFITSRADVPPVINPYPDPGTHQDQDEKSSIERLFGTGPRDPTVAWWHQGHIGPGHRQHRSRGGASDRVAGEL
jgi:hypothetical protein